MRRNICVNCGTFIMKSAINDPYICRECEKLLEGADKVERYVHLGNY